MERPTAIKTERAWNGLYPVAVNDIIICVESVTQGYIKDK
jgi:hypothetical protein